MRHPLLLIIATMLFAATGLQAQDSAPQTESAAPVIEWTSPLYHLDTPLKLQKTASMRPYNCLTNYYYNATAGVTQYIDSTPTYKWGMRMSLPSSQSVTVCTVWTVGVDFRWVPKTQGIIDTMHIYMREVNPPYNEFYHVKYLMKLGENVGGVEIDPPVPGNARPIINPKRDVYVGIYITGQYGSKVTWRIKKPSQYNSPPRSIIWSGGNPVPVGGIVGQSADWVFQATPCCNFSIPVELSTFSGLYDGQNVELQWRTETETDNFQFEIERSLHAQGPWENRGFVAGHGTSLTPQDYTFNDPVGNGPNVPDAYWYRLRQKDFDGTVNDIRAIRVSTAPPTATAFKLHTPYPSPIQSNGHTTIAYELPDESPVTISVYDALGKEVQTLVDRVVPAGYHEAAWYPVLASRALGQGTYFVTMKTNTFMQTRKITLLK